MDRNVLLGKLPPYLHRYTTIKNDQSVYDIVKEVLEAHQIFASDYDRIGDDFNYGSNLDIAKRLFNFLKQNVKYDIESEESQTTKSPSALLVQGYGDCKHYAGFIAGVFDALNRIGRNIDWNYRFASYNLFDKEPGHVFVVMRDNGKEYWIDPVLKSFNERLEPTFILDKKPKQMLQRVSGIYDVNEDTIFLDDEDRELSPELLQAINLLLQYKILDAEGNVNDQLLIHYANALAPDEFNKLADARVLIHQQSINGLFSGIWRGVKKVTLAAPRNAYLGLVALNFRGFATKLANVIYQADGKTFDSVNQKKIYDKWNSLGGDWHALHKAIDSGKKKKAILAGTVGIVPAAAPAVAWYTIAATIIAALTPIITAALKTKQQSQLAYDPSMYDPSAYQPTSSNGIMDFIQNNPLIVAGAAAVGIFLFTQKRSS